MTVYTYKLIFIYIIDMPYYAKTKQTVNINMKALTLTDDENYQLCILAI